LVAKRLSNNMDPGIVTQVKLDFKALWHFAKNNEELSGVVIIIIIIKCELI